MSPLDAAILAGAFALGAIPFSYLLGRWRGIDLRRSGSGNVGATNLARSTGWAVGASGLLLDAGKGAAAVLVARHAGSGGIFLQTAAGLLAILGHNFTPFLRGRGGKGVATGAGVFAVLTPSAFGTALVVFLVTVLISRMVSLGSILAAIALPVAAWLLDGNPGVILAALASGLLITARHGENIKRMARGTENRFGGSGGGLRMSG